MKRVLAIIPTDGPVLPECYGALLVQDYALYSILIHAQRPFARHKTMDSALNRNTIREMALHSDAEHFLFVDSDTVLPSDALTRLISHGKDIVGGWYPLVHESQRWAVATYEDGVFRNFSAPVPGLVPVDMVGLGCALVSRRVYEAVSFNPGLLPGDTVTLADGRHCPMGICAKWGIEARAAGFELYADGAVVCQHLPRPRAGGSAR